MCCHAVVEKCIRLLLSLYIQDCNACYLGNRAYHMSSVSSVKEETKDLIINLTAPETLSDAVTVVVDEMTGNNRRVVATTTMEPNTLLYTGQPFLECALDEEKNTIPLLLALNNLSETELKQLREHVTTHALYPRTDAEKMEIFYRFYGEAGKNRKLLEQFEHVIVAVVKMNWFDLFLKARTERRGVYLQGSFFNHSCLPNAMYDIDDKGTLTIHSIREIKRDEEVTINYVLIPAFLAMNNATERRKMLLEEFKFSCECASCNHPENTELYPRNLVTRNPIVYARLQESLRRQYRLMLGMTDVSEIDVLVTKQLSLTMYCSTCGFLLPCSKHANQ